MELKEFIKKSLDDIVQGIQEAQQTQTGAMINPPVRQAHGPNREILIRTGRLWDSQDHLLIEQVHFDVAVTAEDENKIEGGFTVGIQVLGLGGKAGIDNNSRNTSVSRIQFSVPVKYPLSKQDTTRQASVEPSMQREMVDQDEDGGHPLVDVRR